MARAAERKAHREIVRKEVAEKLQVVRKFTGDKFSATRGYDGRQFLSRSRQKTIAKYFDTIYELTGRPHKVITPKRGEKREVFEFTGQKGHPKFSKAIVVLPDAEGSYDFYVDRARPKGSQFVVENRKTRERSWHIPAEVFLDENEALYDEDEEPPAEFFEQVIEEYGHDGAAYMIEAGDYHMWGSMGQRKAVAEKMADLFKQYGAQVFDPYDKNSHFIGNWFRGVQVFSKLEGAGKYMAQQYRADLENMKKYGRSFGEHIRELPDGSLVRFVKGRIVPESRRYPEKRKARSYGKYKRPRK